MEQQLFDAIKAGNVEAVRQLIKQQPSLKEARDASGASVLLIAAYNMKPDVVNALLELGAPVDIFEASVLGKVDRINEILKASPARASEHAPDGFTPVALAAFFGQPAAVKALIAAGADVNAKDHIEDSPYLYAGAEGRNEILRMTLEAGADLKSTNRYGGTALIPAAHHGHPETVAIQLRSRIDKDHVNRLGWTALLEAVILGDGGPTYARIVQMLVKAGANPNIADRSGVTPLAHARARNLTEIAKILEAAGAR